MDTPEALAALRTLAALPLLRRQYLASLVATAPTNQDRNRIVVMAKRENTDQRWATEQALKAEFSARREWASRNRERPAEGPQKPSQRGERVERGDSATPTHRPVSVRYVEPTKTATPEQARERRPLMAPNRRYEPEQVPSKTPHTGRTHGIVSTYNHGCRCDACSEASKRHGRAYRARKKANSGKSGR